TGPVMIGLAMPSRTCSRWSRNTKLSPAVMSRLLGELDRPLRAVGGRAPRQRLQVGRHHAVAEDGAVAFVVFAEQLRGYVVAATVSLTPIDVDLHLHCDAPVSAALRVV